VKGVAVFKLHFTREQESCRALLELEQAREGSRLTLQ
jgi:hypothetical protein